MREEADAAADAAATEERALVFAKEAELAREKQRLEAAEAERSGVM